MSGSSKPWARAMAQLAFADARAAFVSSENSFTALERHLLPLGPLRASSTSLAASAVRLAGGSSKNPSTIASSPRMRSSSSSYLELQAHRAS